MGGSSKTTTSLPGWAVGGAQQLFHTGLGTLDPNNPSAAGGINLKPYNPALDQTVVGFNPTQQAGMDYLLGASGGSAGLAGSGYDQLQRTLSGDYLNANPYLDTTYARMARGVTDQYKNAVAPGLQAQAMQAGVSGGSAEADQRMQNQYGLGTTLNDLANQVYGGNYANERQNQIGALGQIGAAQQALMMPGQTALDVGTLRQGQSQTEADAATANAAQREEWPQKLLSWGGNFINTITGGGGKVDVGASK